MCFNLFEQLIPPLQSSSSPLVDLDLAFHYFTFSVEFYALFIYSDWQ